MASLSTNGAALLVFVTCLAVFDIFSSLSNLSENLQIFTQSSSQKLGLYFMILYFLFFYRGSDGKSLFFGDCRLAYFFGILDLSQLFKKFLLSLGILLFTIYEYFQCHIYISLPCANYSRFQMLNMSFLSEIVYHMILPFLSLVTRCGNCCVSSDWTFKAIQICSKSNFY